MTRILVTGATGIVGSRVSAALANTDHDVRTLVRDPAAAAALLPDGIRPVRGDYADPASLDAALDGVDAVFLACGNLPQQVEFEIRMVDRAAAAGVRRIVKLSARGADLASPVAFWDWHAQIENHLAASGVPSVVLRPGFLMTNLMASADAVREHGLLVAPAGTARIAMVDPRDVTAVAATRSPRTATRGGSTP